MISFGVLVVINYGVGSFGCFSEEVFFSLFYVVYYCIECYKIFVEDVRVVVVNDVFIFVIFFCFVIFVDCEIGVYVLSDFRNCIYVCSRY